MTAARTALLQMLTSRLLALLATVVGFAVLGRLLKPEDFGYFAIAAAAFYMLKSLANFGLRQYMIRSDREIDPAALSSAAGLSFSIAAAGCLLFVAAGTLLSGEMIPGPVANALVPLGIALLAGPLILGVEVQLHRALDFRLFARTMLLATVLEVSVAIALALMGFGAVALALGLLCSQLATAIVLLVFGGTQHVSWPRFAPSSFRVFLGFGSRLSVINLLPNLVTLVLIGALGAFAGPAVTGLYNRAKTMFDLLDRIVLEGASPVILPIMSDALRRGVSPQHVLAKKLDYLTALCWPALALMGLLAEPLIFFLLGPQWDAAVPALRILALAGLALPFTKMSVKFFTAIDALGAYLKIQLAFQLATLTLGVAAAAISLEAFCAAIAATLIGKAVWISLWLHRRYEAGESGVRLALGRGAGITVATVAVPTLLLATGGLGPIGLLAASLSAAAVMWLGSLLVMRHPLAGDLRAVVFRPVRRAVLRTGALR